MLGLIALLLTAQSAFAASPLPAPPGTPAGPSVHSTKAAQPGPCACDPAALQAWREQSLPTLSADSPMAVRELPDRLSEGDSLCVHWVCLPTVVTVIAYAAVLRTPLGGLSRGTQRVVFAPGTPAAGGHVSWQVPWLDGLRGTLVIKGYAAEGALAQVTLHPFRFRPRELRDMPDDALYVHLTDHKHQRLYLQRDGKLVFAALCSGGSTGRMREERYCGRGIHDHTGWFTVIQKDARHISTLNPEWYMPHSLRFFRAHHIHGTSPNQYRKLGRPASHGCIRLHRTDARTLFYKVKVGEKVCIQ